MAATFNSSETPKHSNLIDLPIENSKNDKLEVKVFVKALESFICESETPMTIAIQGEWGSGKTSFMKQIWNDLCVDNFQGKKKDFAKFFGIWCPAWEYALFNEPKDILINLMQGILTELARLDKNNFKMNQTIQVIGGFIKTFARTSLHVAAASAGVPEELLREIAPDKPRPIASIHDLNIALSKVIQSCLDATRQTERKKNGIIFFIDDLDRLDPVIAVQFLELVKNIFDLKNCIFILAIDYDVVVRGLKPRFGFNTEEREFRSFFDKIIQLPFSVPMTSYDLEKYLEEAITHIGFLQQNELKTLLPLDSSSDFLDDIISSDSSSDDENTIQVKQLITFITSISAGKNPRTIKRLLNTLSLINKIQIEKHYLLSNKNNKTICTPENDIDKDRITEKVILFCLVSLQISYPEVYIHLCDDPAFMDWNTNAAHMQGYGELDENEEKTLSEQSEFDEDFEKIIYLYCRNIPHLKQSAANISQIFNIMRALIIFSNHKKLFNTTGIKNLDLLEGLKPEMLYDIYTFEKKEDEQTDEETKQLAEKLEKQRTAISEIISRAMEMLIGIAGTSGYGAISQTREKKTYTKKKVFTTLEEYEEILTEGYEKSLSLFKELKMEIDNIFGEGLITYEYKSDFKILIRPAHPKSAKGGQRVLITFTPLKISERNLKVNIYGENIFYLYDSIEPMRQHSLTLIRRFNELSQDKLPVPDQGYPDPGRDSECAPAEEEKSI